MDCPVCKYPNPQGATHCGMCYEVFNRSAAQAYLHAVKREKHQTEEPQAPITASETDTITQKITDTLEKVDWTAVRSKAFSLFETLLRFKKIFFIGAGLIGVVMMIQFLTRPALWFHLFGDRLQYVFSDKAPAQYLVGINQDIKSWSERQSRLDTPLEEFKVEEIGNVILEKNKTAPKNLPLIVVHAKEWIQMLHDSKGSESHTLPLNHPSLAGARIVLSRKGALLQRHYTLSPRLAKGLFLLVPKFPSQALKCGQTWDERVEWLDQYNDWKIYWAGTFHWTVGDLEPCGSDSCVKLIYQADIHPHLRGAPSWAFSRMPRIQTQAATEGMALFDASHGRLVTNIFTYEGLLHIPIADLGRIPWELRIGRRVRGQPGEIVIRYLNKIDIRKN